MKIISGSKKSYLIKAPKNLPVSTRPTSGLVKESLFNILGNYFDFNKVNILDLYSGTGNISFEFSSRGCRNVDSVDINSKCINFIKKKSLELSFNINAIRSSAEKFIKKGKTKYDIIYADPPYQYIFEEYKSLIDLVFDFDIIENHGFLVIEHEKKVDLDKHKMFHFKKKYGGTLLSFFKKASL